MLEMHFPPGWAGSWLAPAGQNSALCTFPAAVDCTSLAPSSVAACTHLSAGARNPPERREAPGHRGGACVSFGKDQASPGCCSHRWLQRADDTRRTAQEAVWPLLSPHVPSFWPNQINSSRAPEKSKVLLAVHQPETALGCPRPHSCVRHGYTRCSKGCVRAAHL